MLLTNDVRSSFDGMLSEPPAMFDMAIVLLEIRDEATEDQEIGNGATEPTPKPIPGTGLLIRPTEVQEPVPNHLATLPTFASRGVSHWGRMPIALYGSTSE
jgi:hypothetical protein